MHPKNTYYNSGNTKNKIHCDNCDKQKKIDCDNCDEQKKIYTISGRTTEEVLDSTINILIDHYQCNKEVMDDDDRIKNLENIVDLIRIKEYI